MLSQRSDVKFNILKRKEFVQVKMVFFAISNQDISPDNL